MRGTKETLGGMKEGTKARSRATGKATAAGAKRPAKAAGYAEAGHAGLSRGSRKATAKKGGASK